MAKKHTEPELELEAASRCGDTQAVRLLLNQGVSARAADSAALKAAIAADHYPVGALLLEAGADPYAYPVHLALGLRNPAWKALYLAERTPLGFAVLRDSRDGGARFVGMILSRRPPQDWRFALGLVAAEHLQDRRLSQEILRGAATHLAPEEVLESLARCELPDCLKQVLRNANPNAGAGRALTCAVFSLMPGNVKLLLEAGADPNLVSGQLLDDLLEQRATQGHEHDALLTLRLLADAGRQVSPAALEAMLPQNPKELSLDL